MQSLAFLMINCRVLSREAELSVELNDHNAGGALAFALGLGDELRNVCHQGPRPTHQA